MFPKILGYVDSFSVKTVKHYSQINRSNRFQQYDYGSHVNRQVYGQSTPPMYNLTEVSVPTIIFYGKHDLYMNSAIMKKISSALPNVQEITQLPFNHYDFILARDLNKYLNGKIVKSLDASHSNRHYAYNSNSVYQY